MNLLVDVNMKKISVLPVLLVWITGVCWAGEPQTAQLLRTITFNGFRANEIYPEDINGDGQLELLCLQSPGMFKADLCGKPVHERSISCLTAIRSDGTFIWQDGTPNLDYLFQSHVADLMLSVDFFDNSGQRQIALLKKDTLSILDAATGAVQRQATLPADNFSIVRSVHSPQGPRLLLSNTAEAYSPYQYASPAQVYDAANLSFVAEIPAAVGAGHCPRAADINGDGYDELLVGFDAYDSNGAKLWTLSGSHRQPTTFYHVDYSAVRTAGSPLGGMIVYAAQGDVEAGTFAGQRLWHNDFGHPQCVFFGDFRAGDEAASMAVYCCYGQLGAAQQSYMNAHGIPVPPDSNDRDNIAFLNDAGEITGLIFPAKDMDNIHSNEAISLLPGGSPDGSDAIVTRDWGWPQALTMSGETAFVIPEPGGPYYLSPQGYGGSDGFGVRIADLDNDGRAEILVHDALRAWIYEPPIPVPEPSGFVLTGIAMIGHALLAWRRR